MASTYRVIEAPAGDPQELEDFLNTQATQGWHAVSVATVPAGSVNVRSGGSFLRPARRAVRGFKVDGPASQWATATLTYNLWVTLRRDT